MQYNLKKGENTGVAITLGGELISYKSGNGKDYIWSGDAKYWSGINPTLFPYPGTIKGNKFIIEGKEYDAPKHGFAKKSEFEVFNKTEDSITFVLKPNEEIAKNYPYKFELYITHNILENGFKTTYKVKNTDLIPIYFGIGGHTAFNCPANDNEAFTDYDLIFNKLETNPVYQPVLPELDGLMYRESAKKEYLNCDKIELNYEIFKSDALVFSKINSNSISLINRDTKKGLVFELDGFESLAIWTPIFGGSPFICLEPWSVLPDYNDASKEFSKKPNITKLEVGKEIEFSYTMLEL